MEEFIVSQCTNLLYKSSKIGYVRAAIEDSSLPISCKCLKIKAVLAVPKFCEL